MLRQSFSMKQSLAHRVLAILALVIAKTMRGHGVGRRLLQAAEENLAARNVRRVAVNTRFARKDAHEFYDRMGYERNGFRFVKSLPGSGD